MSRLSKQLKNKFCHGSQSNTSICGGGGGGVFSFLNTIKEMGRIFLCPHDSPQKKKRRR